MLRADDLACNPQQNLPHHSMIFFDTAAARNLNDIKTIKFTESYHPEALGLTKDAVWIKTAFNPEPACLEQNWFLQFGNPYLDSIDVYILQNEALVAHYELGDRRSRPAHLNPQRLPAVPISPHFNSESTDGLVIFVRLASQNSISTDMTFITQAQIHTQDLPVLILSAFVASALILLLVFSVILWGLTRQVALLYYIITLLSYGYILATVYGWMHFWGWPSDPWILIAQPVLILSFLLLSNAILAIHQTFNKTYKVLLATAIFLVVLSLISGLIDHLQPALKTVHSLGVLLLLTLLGISGLMVKNNSIAKFYFLVFGVMILALVVRILAIYNVVPANFLLAHLFSIMILIQLIILFFVTLGFYYKHYLALLKQQQQLELEQQLVSQRKLFLRLLSHEFMTPLAIGGAAGRNLADDLNDLAKQDVAPHIIHQMQQDLQTQQRARQRLQDLVSQCLDADYEVNRFEQGFTTLNTFNRIVYQNLNKIEQRPRIIIEWALQPERPSEPQNSLRIKGDAEPLVMAMNMVVNNALKYSKPDQNVIITFAIHDAQLIIAVRDFGIGFDQDTDITQAFKRGRNTQSTSGLGLGLYISQDILQRYNGQLIIEPQQPGSLVTLQVPIYRS